MSSIEECPSETFGDSSLLTNLILVSGKTYHMKLKRCHMTPEVSDFVTGSLKDTDKHIEVVDRHHVTTKQKVQVQMRICDNNGDPFIVTLHNILLASDFCNRLFSIITLMNLGHNCLFHKGFFMVYFGSKEKNTLTLAHIAQSKHAF